MPLPRPARPSVLLADLRAFLASRERHQIVFAGVAVLMPALILVGFLADSDFGPPPARIIYVQNWRADRTDKEIVAQQKIDSKALAEARERRRQEYVRLGRSLGIEE